MQLTEETVGLLVQRALVLEPLADKSGCTTRYEDLPGRPLESFVTAGLNVGPIFSQFAAEWLQGRQRTLFHYFTQALKTSKTGGKYVNFGLLEILFPAVAARIECDNPDEVVAKVIELMRQAPQSDVRELVGARKLAWSTSEKREAKLKDLTRIVCAAPNPYAFYEAMGAAEPHGSAAQWVANYQEGLPLLARQFDSLRSQTTGSMLDKIKIAYEEVRKDYPDVRAGILADMSAAAIFLYLSYTKNV